MERTLHIFDFLETTPEGIPHVCVLVGDDAFLKRLAVEKLRRALRGDDEEEMSVSSWDASMAEWRDISDELSTASLFGPTNRMVLLRSADTFVSAHRTQLEDYVQAPSSTSTFLLEVDSWPKTTRLAKLVAKTGLTITCKPPERSFGQNRVVDRAKLSPWVTRWAEVEHGLKLHSTATEEMLGLVNDNLGLLNQELCKLALTVENPRKVTAKDVIEIVGGWRTRTTWDLLDAACEGNAAEALIQLDRMLISGEHPQALFGAFSWSLRRFAAATRNVQWMESCRERPKLRDALVNAGFRTFPPDALGQAESQLRNIGRERAGQIYQWLLELDLQLKGSHASPERARFGIETLLLRLSREAKPPRLPSQSERAHDRTG